MFLTNNMYRREASQNFTLGNDADWVALPGTGDQAEAGPVPGSVPRLGVQGVEHRAGEVGRDVAPAASVPAPAVGPRPPAPAAPWSPRGTGPSQCLGLPPGPPRCAAVPWSPAPARARYSDCGNLSRWSRNCGSNQRKYVCKITVNFTPSNSLLPSLYSSLPDVGRRGPR